MYEILFGERWFQSWCIMWNNLIECHIPLALSACYIRHQSREWHKCWRLSNTFSHARPCPQASWQGFLFTKDPPDSVRPKWDGSRSGITTKVSKLLPWSNGLTWLAGLHHCWNNLSYVGVHIEIYPLLMGNAESKKNNTKHTSSSKVSQESSRPQPMLIYVFSGKIFILL